MKQDHAGDWQLDQVRCVLELFYERAFADPMIGYFFAGSDRNQLIEAQSAFFAQLLGVRPRPEYRGRGFIAGHDRLPTLRRGHFGRRRVLLQEAMTRCGVPHPLQQAWLARERDLEASWWKRTASKP